MSVSFNWKFLNYVGNVGRLFSNQFSSGRVLTSSLNSGMEKNLSSPGFCFIFNFQNRKYYRNIMPRLSQTLNSVYFSQKFFKDVKHFIIET